MHRSLATLAAPARLTRALARGRALPAMLLLLLTVGASQPPYTVPPKAVHTLVGFSFSPATAAYVGLDPNQALRQLLRSLHPDLVRIPIYWDAVAPTADALDFTSVDALLATVTASNSRRHLGRTQVILVAGARNLGWPEAHLPAWAAGQGPVDLGAITSTPEYLQYLAATFHHYAASPLLYAWQVENEPLDNTNQSLGAVALEGQVVADEVTLVKSIDSIHRVIVTTFNSASLSLDIQATSRIGWLLGSLPGPKPAGHPQPALDLADILGLDIYVDTPSTPLAQASVSQRIGWKAATLSYWASRAGENGKEVWVTEMQGAPWNGEPGFSEEDLLESAHQYAGTGVSAVLIWGVEDWLAAPSWMLAGQAAFRTLRH